MKVEVV